MAHPHRLFSFPRQQTNFSGYLPIVAEFPILQAGAIGLKAASHAGVFIVPGPACYMGGNIVAGVLYPGVHLSETLNLFIDVGTNGEIVLGDQTFLMTAACSVGPAFEGGGICRFYGPFRRARHGFFQQHQIYG